MQTQQRKILAIILILIGLAALVFGVWLLWGLLFGDSEGGLNLAEPGNDLNVNSRNIPEPQTYEAPIVVQGETEFDETSRGSDIVEATNRAIYVVGLIGSGTSQNGFLGYTDALAYSTPKFQAYLQSEQLKMKQAHPADGEIYGMTTRVLSTKVIEGGNGSQKIVLELQAQKAEDAGNRASPTNIIYETYEASLVKQADGSFLMDYLAE